MIMIISIEVNCLRANKLRQSLNTHLRIRTQADRFLNRHFNLSFLRTHYRDGNPISPLINFNPSMLLYVCICLPHRCLTADAGVFVSSSLNISAKETNTMSTGLAKNKCWGRLVRQKAVLQYGRRQMTDWLTNEMFSLSNCNVYYLCNLIEVEVIFFKMTYEILRTDI